MSLTRRQERALSQIEQALRAADPRLESMFACLGLAIRSHEPGPPAEAITGRPSARTLIVFVMVIVFLAGALVAGIRSANGDCPQLPSKQAFSATVARPALCSPSANVLGRGGR